MTQSDDKPPRKQPRKKRSSKASANKKDQKKESTENEDSARDIYKEKIRQALQENLDEFIKEKNLNQKQISAINSYIEEHLSCFVLLGYTVDGSPVSLVNAPSQKDSDSLGTLIQKFLSKYIEPPSNISMI